MMYQLHYDNNTYLCNIFVGEYYIGTAGSYSNTLSVIPRVYPKYDF